MSGAARTAASRKGRTTESKLEELDLNFEVVEDNVTPILPHQLKVKDFYETPSVQITVALFICSNFVVSACEAQMVKEVAKDPGLEEIFKAFEWIFNLVFLVELIINMYGSFFWFFWTGPNQGWNVFDFVIVTSSMVNLGLEGSAVDLSVLRLLRTFRVFRLFKRVPSLRLIIEGVLASITGVLNAFAVLFIFMAIWSIMGVEFFQGKMSDDYGPYFDTFFYAMFTMFQMLTMDSWCSYITRTLVYDLDFKLASMFSISFIFIASIVLTNVVVAILLERFLTKVKEQEQKKAFQKRREELMAKLELQKLEKMGIKVDSIKQSLVAVKQPRKGFLDKKLPFQDKMKNFYFSDRVQIFVGLLILLNFIMGASGAQLLPEEGSDLEAAFKVGEWFFAMIFLAELILNMYGSFFWEFWVGENGAWNIFDFCIVVISLLAVLLGNVPGISVLRLFRAFRVMRLFKRIESLRLIIEAVLTTLPKVFQAFTVLGILMGVWAIMAVEFFADVAPQEFGNFLKAMLSMWQILTGDSWASGTYMSRYLLFDQNKWFTPIFFISYIFVASIIMSNVVIAILLEGYLQKSTELREKKIKENEESEKEKASEMRRENSLDAVELTTVAEADWVKEIDEAAMDDKDEDFVSSSEIETGTYLKMVVTAFRDADVRSSLQRDELQKITSILKGNKVAKAVVDLAYHHDNSAGAPDSKPSSLLRLLMGKQNINLRQAKRGTRRRDSTVSNTSWS